MPKKRKHKIIIDTNLFISFLIGKRLKVLKKYLIESNIELVFAEQNISELTEVTNRNKFRKYFPNSEVKKLVDFIRITGNIYELKKIQKICRDPKDDFFSPYQKKQRLIF